MNLECLNNINNQFISRTNSQKMLDIIVAALTNGFLKFLARFSGRRRLHRKQTEQQTNHLQEEQRQSMLCHNSHLTNNSTNLKIPLFILLLLSTLCNLADACSSRTTPKPRPPTPTPRPNITFHTYKCPPAYAEWYCLNDATCFTVKIGESLLYNCECADGYMGPRCEYKDLDGSYLATRPRVMLETASIAGGAVSALFLALVVGFFAYVKWHQGKKREQLEGLYNNMPSQQQHVNEMNGDGGHVNSVDVVDSVGNGDRCYCQNVQFSNLSSNQTNGDNIRDELKHPQESQFSVAHHAHHHSVMVSHPHPLPPPPPKRPFGPHHYCSISMGDVIMKR